MNKLFLLFALLIGSLTAQAESTSLRTQHYNLKNGLAIQGYDPVAYFSKTAVKGSSKYSHTEKGVTYHFSSAANLAKFKASPAKYEPQYGGWCAYALAIDKGKVKINPKSYKLVNGKLYLFYNTPLGGNTLKKWNEKNNTSQVNAANMAWEKNLK